eukprot:Nk52_evm72s352 gene=Nk52_evmTU72s352
MSKTAVAEADSSSSDDEPLSRKVLNSKSSTLINGAKVPNKQHAAPPSSNQSKSVPGVENKPPELSRKASSSSSGKKAKNNECDSDEDFQPSKKKSKPEPDSSSSDDNPLSDLVTSKLSKENSRKKSLSRKSSPAASRSNSRSVSRSASRAGSRKSSIKGTKSVKKEESESSDDEVPLVNRLNSEMKKIHKTEVKKEHSGDGKQKRKLSKKSSKVENPVVKAEPKPSQSKKVVDTSTSSDDEPLSSKIIPSSSNVKKKNPAQKRKASVKNEDGNVSSSSDDIPLAHMAKKTKTGASSSKKKKNGVDSKDGKSPKGKVGKKAKKEEEEDDRYKWWEGHVEHEDGIKWKSLIHKGPILAPDYVPLPSNVKLYYDGKPFDLSVQAEEVAGFYAVMLNTDYMQKKAFNLNFFKDWRRSMTKSERELITDLTKCDFTKIQKYYEEEREKKKNKTKEEKLKIKEDNAKLVEEYGYAMIDGRKEKIGNFRVEPPGLFRGRGDHPKMGKLKKRVQPEDIIINISKGAPVPKPPEGHKWKEVQHNNTVTWLACWIENIQQAYKYVMFNPASTLKGLNDMKKYEKARELKKHIDKIRSEYKRDMKDKMMFVRQRATALYLIDKLALRAGNEKDSDEEADTVGCCSLRLEHIELVEPRTVKFDFLGKDSIRYENEVEVDPQAFANLRIFCKRKNPNDLLFDRLNVSKLNKHLNSLMPGLSAKVFRTYNASITLNQEVKKTPPHGTVEEKILEYNRANRAVAILCNHQRAAPKTHDAQMGKLEDKIEETKKQLKETKKELKKAKAEEKANPTAKGAKQLTSLAKKVKRLKERVEKDEIKKTDKDENKTIALGTSKLNYLDPRISVAWAKRHNVPIEKVYNKTQREKFAWAMNAPPDFEF